MQPRLPPPASGLWLRFVYSSNTGAMDLAAGVTEVPTTCQEPSDRCSVNAMAHKH